MTEPFIRKIKSKRITTEEADLLNNGLRGLLILLFIIYALILIRTAWLSDDAYITFRTVRHFIQGNGLVYNLSYRVQSYTHPLWMFFISFFYFFTRDVYFTVIFLSIIISLIAVYLFGFRMCRSTEESITGLLILIFSRAFIDYSTSGLENPLTHLLLVLFYLFYFRGKTDKRHILYLTLITALILTNRMDMVLVVAPALLERYYYFFKGNGVRLMKRFGIILTGFSPFILWELFSLFYYGFLFPNTAYAKLFSGISSWKLMKQGLCYYLHSFDVDPLTLLVIGFAISMAIWTRNRENLLIVGGIGLYLVYILRIGGDFMSGRFFAGLVLPALFVLFRRGQRSILHFAVIVGLILIIGYSADVPPVLSNSEYGVKESRAAFINKKGIADERAVYYRHTGLLRITKNNETPAQFYDYMKKILINDRIKDQVYVLGQLGYVGFYGPRKMIILDKYALTDPLLSRLPALENSRIGHFQRTIPIGYMDTLISGKNQIQNKDLAQYYDKLVVITHGKLFSWNRIKEIIRFNLGNYDHWVKSAQ